jgi:hypothetical protein
MKNVAAGSLKCKAGRANWLERLTKVRNFTWMLVGVGLISGCALSAFAAPLRPLDDEAAADSEGKAPASRAVRLSFVDGPVQVVQDGQVIADPAYANLPLFEGAQVITGGDGRAEVQLEDGSLARLSPNTTITFSVMQQQGNGTKTEIVVNNGLAYFELQPSTGEHSLRVHYGTTSFAASSFSVVRVTADEAPGELAVFSGNVRLDRGNTLQLDVHGGESLHLNGTEGSGYDIAETIEPDSWDSWNADRDQLLNSESAEKTAASGSFVNNQGVGMNDLDANGNWYDVPSQGMVWSPYDAQLQGAGWDPYGFGHWVYYPRYGYVFVSGYGWGYAPYSCGMWNFYDNFGLGWAPGGGCNPWWGGGGYYGGYGGGGWYNIGRSPRGYQPPKRPQPGPIHPHPGGPRPGPHPVTPVRRVGLPAVPVDRRPSGGGVPVTGHPRPTQPVTIAGHTVEPLRPVAPRTTYDRVNDRANGFTGRENGGQTPVYGVQSGNTPHPGYVPMPSRPIGQPQPGYRPPSGGYTPPSRPQQPSGGYTPPSRPQPQPQQPSHPSYGGGGGYSGGGHPSAPAPAPHSSPAPAPHK